MGLYCDEFFDSDFLEDLYGDFMDKDVGEFWVILYNVRLKYINMGNVMGLVGDLRCYVCCVNEKFECMVVINFSYYFKSD